MNLISVYTRPDRHELLWRLLSERDPEVNISHREMPSFEEHIAFVESKPYEAWYFIDEDIDEFLRADVGACYLTKVNEIGIHLFEEWQGNGYGPQAIKMLMKQHGERRYLANISLANHRSHDMFFELGFRPKQTTYERLP